LGLGGVSLLYKKPFCVAFRFCIRIASFLFLYVAPRDELHGLQAGTSPSAMLPPASCSTK
jgi:hypothetical protein